MSRIRVLICRVDDADGDWMTELAAFDLPEADISVLQPETVLDELETITQDTGNAILRHMLQAKWETIDARLAQQYRRRFSLNICRPVATRRSRWPAASPRGYPRSHCLARSSSIEIRKRT